MEKTLLIIACCLSLSGCGNDDKKEAVPEKMVTPLPLPLEGLGELKLTPDVDNCDSQRGFVSWFVEKYASPYEVEYTSCIHPLVDSESRLPAEFDSIKPKCTGANWCSYLTAKLKSETTTFNLAVSLTQTGDKLSGIVVTASDDPFQMLFPGKPEPESFYQYTMNNAGSDKLPLMFATYDAAIKESRISLH